MKSSKTLFQEVVDSIDLDESPEEIRSIAYFLLTSIFDITKTDILAGHMVPFTQAAALALQKSLKRINQGEPVQYVLGEEYFFGRKFHINPSVLIPRPETEGLIRVVLDYISNHPENKRRAGSFKILDIGTGSGCIPVTLFREIPRAKIYATDVSNAALSVAVDNAAVHKAEITFIEHNILTEKIPVSGLDVIVSNPPYVTETEKDKLNKNVFDHEPHQALFVPDDDPLLFYRQIVPGAREALNDNGLLAVEINEVYGNQVSALFVEGGFSAVEIVDDISGKPRIVQGRSGGAVK